MTLTNRTRRQKVLGSLAVVGVLAAVIVAVAVTSGGADRNSQGAGAVHTGHAGHFGGRGDLPVAAGYLGLTTLQLRSKLRTQTLGEVAASTSGRSAAGLIGAILAARRATLSAAVAAGELTRAEASSRIATVRRGVAGKVNRAGGYGVGAGGVGGIPGLTSAARYLGLTSERLRNDLRSGRTLAQVANATGGRSAAGLIATLVAERRAVFDAAVAAGRLTRARESKLLAGLSQRITAEVNRVPRVAGATG
jgi:hypothetical protein